MKAIWKYEILIDDYFEIEMQKDARILDVQTQKENIVIWCLLDTDAEKEIRKFRLAGTGHEIKEDEKNLKYIGSGQLAEGDFIYHIFEILNYVNRV